MREDEKYQQHNKMKINTSSKCSHCFDELGRSMLMVFLVSCQLRCHYHRKRLNQLPDYSIHTHTHTNKQEQRKGPIRLNGSQWFSQRAVRFHLVLYKPTR